MNDEPNWGTIDGLPVDGFYPYFGHTVCAAHGPTCGHGGVRTNYPTPGAEDWGPEEIERERVVFTAIRQEDWLGPIKPGWNRHDPWDVPEDYWEVPTPAASTAPSASPVMNEDDLRLIEKVARDAERSLAVEAIFNQMREAMMAPRNAAVADRETRPRVPSERPASTLEARVASALEDDPEETMSTLAEPEGQTRKRPSAYEQCNLRKLNVSGGEHGCENPAEHEGFRNQLHDILLDAGDGSVKQGAITLIFFVPMMLIAILTVLGALQDPLGAWFNMAPFGPVHFAPLGGG